MPPAGGGGGGAAAVTAGGDQAGQQQQPAVKGLLSGLFRAVIMWYFMRQFFGGGSKAPPKEVDGVPVIGGGVLAPKFPRGHHVDLHVFVSELDTWQAAADAGQPPVWVAADVALGLPTDLKHTFIYQPSEVGWGVGGGIASECVTDSLIFLLIDYISSPRSQQDS